MICRYESESAVSAEEQKRTGRKEAKGEEGVAYDGALPMLWGAAPSTKDLHCARGGFPGRGPDPEQ